MPLYEYECQACGHRLEAQQKLADAPLKTCPACEKDELGKLISATAFTLKGGGWYKDLYASPKPGAESGKSGDKPAAASDKPASDKPAAAASDKKSGGSNSSGGSGGAGGSSTPSSSGGGSSAAAAA